MMLWVMLIRKLTADIAAKLANVFNTTGECWLTKRQYPGLVGTA